MSGTEEDQVGEQLDWYSDTRLDIETDIIDVSLINFGNHDSWLQPSIRNPAEYRVHDLRAWLRADVEQDSKDSQDNRRSIDTRTFTRPKKRSGRLSFESIVEVTTPPSPDVWKPRASETTESRRLDEEDAESASQRRDSTPAMLRPNSSADGVCSADVTLTSGQESLEAFLNMSQSSGIDSFINLAEPEFSDAIMNVSQPSLLYSSMLSQTLNQSQAMNQSQTSNNSQIFNQSSIMDSQILTESMMQSSMFGDVTDVQFNEIFTCNNADVTVVENTSFSNPNEKTFVDSTITHSSKPLNGTFDATVSNDVYSMDATYTPVMLNKTLTNNLPLPNDPHASYTVDPKCQIFDAKLVVDDTSFVISKDVPTNTSYVVHDETTDPRFADEIDHDIVDDATLNVPPTSNDQNDTFNVRNFDATFERTPSSSPRKLSINSTFKRVDTSVEKLSMELRVPKFTEQQNDTFDVREFDATFEKTAPSPRRSSTNSTVTLPTATIAKSSTNHSTTLTLKPPNFPNMDTTYDNNRDDVPNRYNTYRKTSTVSRAKNENFNPTENLSNETVNIVASMENLDATFNKPAPKIHRKLNGPRTLSRLPQTLQKSNPNLISNSLKAVNTAVGRSAIPSFGFSKLARPNTVRNAEASLTSKLYGLAKMKSGSEQRLEITRNNTVDYPINATGGSTESIESTQSAHSAPDFDDRLSVCSDSSHNSYSSRTMNIKDLQKSNHLRVDYAKPESTPKPNRRVLENTWVETANDLPSPILKNGTGIYVSRDSSPRGADMTVQTSSPLLSPVGSLQNLTTTVAVTNKDNNADETKVLSPRNQQIATRRPTDATCKPVKNSGDNKTGLRPPASWSSTNQRPVSGIPRPASRIPAPRFVRPATKINQGDMKKGCL